MSIPDHIIEQINERADLVGIIGRHVPLKKSGASFKACCPFHKEKTPSFYVHPREGYYYCFGCKASGNAISFLMDYEGASFLEAVETLAAQTGTTIPKDKPNPALKYKKQPAQHLRRQSGQSKPANQPADQSSNQAIDQSGSHLTKRATEQSGGKQSKTELNTAKPSKPAPVITSAPVPMGDVNDIDVANAAFADVSGEFYDSYYDHAADMSAASGEGAAHVVGHRQQPVKRGQQPSSSPQSGKDGDLFELTERLCVYYQNQLKTSPKALLYLNQRGLTEKSIDTFRLGFAPSDWQHLERAFAEDVEGLKMLGLVRTSESGRSFDLLRERIIFPIRDRRGRVVGFGARALSGEVQPKYINSPESVIFKKQQILYGLYEGRKARADSWLVVEGFMDVIALYQAGVYGAVASMGTALGVDALKRLFAMNHKLTLAFDGDSAGQTAAWRAMEVALPILDDSYQLHFLTLPDGDDPDGFLKKHGQTEGKSAFLTQLDAATALSDFMYAKLSQQHGIGSAEQKSALMAAAKQLFDKLPKHGSYRRLLYNELRERLGLGFKKFQAGAGASQSHIAQALHDQALNFEGRFSLEEQVVFLLLHSPDAVSKLTQERYGVSLASLLPRDGLIMRLKALIDDGQAELESMSAATTASFLLYAWTDVTQKSALMQGYVAFMAALRDVVGDLDEVQFSAHIDQLLSDWCLTLTERLLKVRLNRAADLHETKVLNQSLLAVRKQLQFRDQS